MKAYHKPVLKPSQQSPDGRLQQFMLSWALVLVLITTLHLPRIQNAMTGLAVEHGPNMAAAGIVGAILEISIVFFTLRFRHVVYQFFIDGLCRRRYHRSHISHMRVDRLRKLIWYQSPSASQTRLVKQRFASSASSRPRFDLLPSAEAQRFPSNSSPRPWISTRTFGGGGGAKAITDFQDMVIDLAASDTPASRELDYALSAPQWALSIFIPDITLPVNEFLLLCSPIPMPDLPSNLTITLRPEHPNTFDSPDDDYSGAIQDHKILFGGRTLLNVLDTVDLRCAHEAGYRSLSFTGSPYRYPLWIKSLAEALLAYKSDRSAWKASTDWLDSSTGPQPERDEVLDEVRDRLDLIHWRGSTSPGQEPILLSSHLSALLSTSWLDSDTIDAASGWILQQNADATQRTAIASTLLLQQLRHYQLLSHHYTHRTRLDTQITSGAIDTLFLPLHVNGNHWTLLRISLERRTFSYADCLHQSTSPPSEHFAIIIWWLSELTPTTMPLLRSPFNFQLPKQRDTSSCGVIIMDLMATSILGLSTWDASLASLRRMEWFLRLTDNAVVSSAADVSMFDDHDNNNGDTDDTDYAPSETQASENEGSASSPSPSTRHNSTVPTSSPTPPFHSSKNLLKRHRPVPKEDSCSDESDSHEGRNLARRRRAGPKSGSSWERQKQLRDQARTPGAMPIQGRLERFRKKIKEDDPRAEFKTQDPLLVFCSTCAEWISMRTLYDVRRWKEHRSSAKCARRRERGLSSQTLLSYFTSTATRNTSAPSHKPPPSSRYPSGTVPRPCPGLSRLSDRRVDRYMSRTSVNGGGAPSRKAIIKELFGPDVGWTDLKRQQEKMVLRREEVLQIWKVSRSGQAVYSSQCELEVHTAFDVPPRPCEACQSLYRVHTFLNTLNQPTPEERHMKHVPKEYRCKELGEIYLKYHGVRDLVEKDDGRSPWLRFAQGVLDGSYQSETLFGMIEALVTKADRLRRGKGLRNMSYTPAFSNFCNLLSSISTRAYQTFRHNFGGRVMSNIRKMRTKLPRFHPGLTAHNVQLAAAVIRKYDYHGPIALSWDDTELEPVISVFQESKDLCVVIGSVDGDIRVNSCDDIEQVLAQAKLNKAEKLRIWLLTIPLPKIPPILIAAVARGVSESADGLFDMHKKVTALLHEEGIHPISLASDGTEVERQTQDLIVESAPAHLEYVIPNKSHGPSANITLLIPLLYSRFPFVPVQDSKHALKTGRNQLLTGARILVMGFYAAFYTLLKFIAESLGPLLLRDVEKLDRQDDRAAARTFSAATLEFSLTNLPDQPGLAIYLFILGELVDAWQNRNISHVMRAKMAMRARFFLMAWRTFIIKHPAYSLGTQFISRESFDIFMTVVNSLLSLIVIHRRYYPLYPLLPWLHSTEPCEHLFSVLRTIKKDFTFADMLSAQPKMQALILGAFGNLTAEEQANQTAAGYHHTYFKADDLDTQELMIWPSDEDFAAASDTAYTEAEALLSILGINASSMIEGFVSPQRVRHDVTSTQSRGPQTLAEVLALYQAPSTSKEEDKMEATELALIAEHVNGSIAIDELPELTDEATEELKLAIHDHLSGAGVSGTSSSCQLSFKASGTMVSSFVTESKRLDQKVLVAERLQHQTQFMARAVRQRGNIVASFNERTLNRLVDKGPTLRESLLIQLSSLGIASTSTSSTAGAGRQIRHTGASVQEGTQAAAVNKTVARTEAAKRFLQKRDAAFCHVRGIHDNFHLANITANFPLSPGHFIIALQPGKKHDIILGQVITMYSKGEAKNSKHEYTESVDSLGLISYVYVRTFTEFAGAMFSSMTCPSLACSTIIQVPRTHIMFSLSTSFQMIAVHDHHTADNQPLTFVTLDPFSVSILSSIQHKSKALYACLKVLRSRKPKSAPDAKAKDDSKDDPSGSDTDDGADSGAE